MQYLGTYLKSLLHNDILVEYHLSYSDLAPRLDRQLYTYNNDEKGSLIADYESEASRHVGSTIP